MVEGKASIWKIEEGFGLFCVVLRTELEPVGGNYCRDRFVLIFWENFLTVRAVRMEWAVSESSSMSQPLALLNRRKVLLVALLWIGSKHCRGCMNFRHLPSPKWSPSRRSPCCYLLPRSHSSCLKVFKWAPLAALLSPLHYCGKHKVLKRDWGKSYVFWNPLPKAVTHLCWEVSIGGTSKFNYFDCKSLNSL